MKKIIKRSFLVIGVLLLTAILVYSAIWLAHYSSFKKYCDVIGYNEQADGYCKTVDGYGYGVFKPVYPEFAGNLSLTHGLSFIGDNGEIPEEGVKYCDLLIFPKLSGKCRVFAKINLFTEDCEVEGNMYSLNPTETHAVILDENMNFLIPPTEMDSTYYNNYKPLIEDAYRLAYEMWGICNPDQPNKSTGE